MRYRCSRCNYSTPRRSNMRDHLHKKIPCPPLKSSESVEDLLHKFNSDAIACKCLHCDKPFTSQQRLAIHTRTCIPSMNAEIVALKENMYLMTLNNQTTTPDDDKTSKPKPRKNLNKSLRLSVWNSSFGIESGIGECFCCCRQVTHQDYEAGHIRAVANGGADHIDNLKVVCRACNRSMGKQDMIEYRRNNFKIPTINQ